MEKCIERTNTIDIPSAPQELEDYYRQLVANYDTAQRGDLYWALLKLGDISQGRGRTNEAFFFLLEAYEVLENDEPLIRLAQICIQQRNWKQAFLFLDAATLTNKEQEYIYNHLLGICSYYAKEYERGKKACKKAIELSPTEPDRILNEQNLEFYANTSV